MPLESYSQLWYAGIMSKEEKKSKKSEEKSKKHGLSSPAKRAIIGVILAVAGVLGFLSFFWQAGVFGQNFLRAVNYLFGAVSPLIPLLFLVAAFVTFRSLKTSIALPLGGFLLFLLAGLGFTELAFGRERVAGWFGYWIAHFVEIGFGRWGGLVLMIALLIIAVLIGFRMPVPGLIKRIVPGQKRGPELTGVKPLNVQKTLFEPKGSSFFMKFSKRDATGNTKAPDILVEEVTTGSIDGTTAKDTETQHFVLPPVDILPVDSGGVSSISEEEIERNIDTIENTLAQFGIEVEMGGVSVGPTVTQYTFKPAQGVRLNKILNLTNDLALALAAHPLRIEAPIPGKSLVGIEVPNTTVSIVHLRSLLENPGYQKKHFALSFPLGRDVSGAPYYDNLGRMPHLLIAGSTGSGKSIAIHNILSTFLFQNTPEDLRLILVDAKKVELTAYTGVPHLLGPVITEAKRTINILQWAGAEMERRLELFADIGVRDINSYNRLISQKREEKLDEYSQRERPLTSRAKMPAVVIVIDELSDIMINYGRELEAGIVRVAQKARAAGIHLILATQRPSIDIVTGLIKANITYRIAFQLPSQVDSRTVLDMAGAEKLLGQGDMLYLPGDSAKPKRIQGVYLTENEVKKIVKFWQKQKIKEEYIEELEEAHTRIISEVGEYEKVGDEDELYEAAKQIVLETGKASATFLQRRLSVGYPRAARLLDMLEERGVIGPAQKNRQREVLQERDDAEPKPGSLGEVQPENDE